MSILFSVSPYCMQDCESTSTPITSSNPMEEHFALRRELKNNEELYQEEFKKAVEAHDCIRQIALVNAHYAEVLSKLPKTDKPHIYKFAPKRIGPLHRFL